VTGKKEDQGAFKTPTLREIAQTAPYMHDGSLATLEEAIEFYNRGGNPNPYLDPELRPLHLTAEEKKSLLAFLRALSGTVQEGVADGKRLVMIDDSESEPPQELIIVLN
jgi:cytochrome c peroxidase